MKAVILAAGEGKRLRPLTLATPKPLLKVRGKPILEYTFNNLPDEVREIILVIGYRGEQIKNYFGEEFGGRKIYYVEQPEPRGTFHALSLAKDFLSDKPFLVLMADDFYKKEDLEKLLDFPNAILTWETLNPERFGISRVSPEGFLEALIEKPSQPCGNLAYTGACVLDKKIFFESIIYGSNSEELLAPMIGTLAEKLPVRVVRASFWLPIGYLEDLDRAEELSV